MIREVWVIGHKNKKTHPELLSELHEDWRRWARPCFERMLNARGILDRRDVRCCRPLSVYRHFSVLARALPCRAQSARDVNSHIPKRIDNPSSTNHALERKMLPTPWFTAAKEAEIMKNSLRLGSFLFVLALLFAGTFVAKSSVSDKLTIFTFSQPVELPGVSLPAGTYAFKVLDSLADRNIVQVWDKDQKKLYGTFVAIPDYTPNPSNKTIIKFSERTPGAPKAVKEWFYPGESMGWEFVYPKKRAMELAKASNQSVPSMPNNLASNITQPAQSSSDSSVAAMK